MKIFSIALAFLVFAARVFASSGEEITGLWTTEDGKAQVEIYSCEKYYCGKIVWLGLPSYPIDDVGGMGGKPRVDRDNPDPALRSRPLRGLKIMEGFTYRGDKTWEQGTIYDPEAGKAYRGKITLVSPRRLELRGYVGIPMFGRTTVWTR